MSKCFEIRHLPTIEMYGGDNTPWKVPLVTELGSPVLHLDGSEYSASLTVTPMMEVVRPGGITASVAAAISISDVSPSVDSAGAVYFMFEMPESQTIGLNGRYLYQIDIRNGEHLRIGQGELRVMQNINQ